MTTETKKADFRQPTEAKKLPRAVADAAAGLILSVADIDARPPQRVFDALTTDEVITWWKNPELYRIEASSRSKARRPTKRRGNRRGDI
jgi:uncharacterized protein YndB with AHSA1/START domain